MRINTKRGQVWFIDYMVATVIFIIAILMYYGINENLTQKDEVELKELALEISSMSSGLLTEGHPHNWSSTNVERPGLLTEKRLDLEKYYQFANLNYNTAKYLFGTTHEFNILFRDATGNLRYLTKTCGAGYNLNSSLQTIDKAAYYSNEHISVTLSDVDYYNLSSLDNLTNKMSEYSLIILEDSKLQLNYSDLLLEYVNEGGVIIASEQIINNESYELWHTKFRNVSSCNSTVIAEHDFVNLNKSDLVNFDNCYTATGNIMALTNLTNTTPASIAKIKYGSGEVFFFSDFNGSSLSKNISSIVFELSEFLRTGTCNEPALDESDNLVSITRFVVNRNKIYKMEALVWA